MSCVDVPTDSNESAPDLSWDKGEQNQAPETCPKILSFSFSRSLQLIHKIKTQP